VSSKSDTRIDARSPERDSPAPQPQGFSTVEPAARTMLFPPLSPNEPVRIPAEPARDQNEPRPRFADGGTQILSAPTRILSAPTRILSAPRAAAQTQHFGVERLLSRREALNRELEQELNRELEQELALMSSESEHPPGTEEIQPILEVSPAPAKPRKLWLRLSMLGLLLATVAMLFYKPPPAEPSPPPRVTPSLAPRLASEGSPPTRVAPAPTPGVAPGPHTTLQRAAADVLAEGRYAEALILYRQLAESEPENPAYAEVVQILEHRIASTTKLDSPQH